MNAFYDKYEFSKVVGWEDRRLSIPKNDMLNDMYQSARYKGSSSAARHIFEWYRFCPIPNSDDEVKSINLLHKYYHQLFN